LPKIKQEIKDGIMKQLLPSIGDANQYYTNYLQPKYVERMDIIEATAEYYNEKYPNLAKIPLTTSECYDTIMWMLPALVDTFSASEDVVKIQGQNAEDDARADKIQKLLNYQTDRQNDGFMFRYHWMLSALQINIGFAKVSWIQKTEQNEQRANVGEQDISALEQNPDIEITDTAVVSEGFSSPDGMMDSPAIYGVTYKETVITENRPLIECLPVTEVRWNSNAKQLKDANFVAHKVRRSIDYLQRKEKEGVYFDIQTAREMTGKSVDDTYERERRDYQRDNNYGVDDLRREIDVYECYCQYPMDENHKEVNELHDWIFTVAGENTLIGAQYNNMGRRHPIIDLLAMPDHWNVVPKKGIIELLAEIQHINVVMTRLIIRHLLVSNEGRRFVNKNLVDQDDIINESPDVGVDGDPRMAVYPMPITNLSPATMPFMEFMQARLRRTIGVSEYNMGTDSAALNPTATGVTAIIEQANKKIKLISRVMAEGYIELYRFLISLNQQYPSKKLNIRLLNEDVEIDASDLEGKLDLMINVGLGSNNKQQELQTTQLMIATLEKVGAAFPGMVTPDKAYDIMKMLLEQMGHKNVDDYINNAETMQKLMAQRDGGDKAAFEKIAGDVEKLIIPAQIQIYQKAGIKITPDDYLIDAKIKAALGQDSTGNIKQEGVPIGNQGGQANSIARPNNIGQAGGGVQGIPAELVQAIRARQAGGIASGQPGTPAVNPAIPGSPAGY